jgi:hypothetical protein
MLTPTKTVSHAKYGDTQTVSATDNSTIAPAKARMDLSKVISVTPFTGHDRYLGVVALVSSMLISFSFSIPNA